MHLPLMTLLLIVWGVFGTLLVLLMVYRGVIGMHEEDLLYLSDSEAGFARDSAEAVKRQEKLSPFIRMSGWGCGGMAVICAVTWVIQNWALLH